MSTEAAATTSTAAAGGETNATTTEVQPNATTAATTETTATTATTETQNLEELPQWARDAIARGNNEAAEFRTKAKTAAEDATKALSAQLAKALGLAKDDEVTDPAKLAQQLTTEQQAKADLARELAIFKAASAHGADPAKLLDSNSFMTSVKGLDPNDGDAVANAIKAAVTANQSLKAARAAAASGVDLGGGTGEQGQITEQQLKTMTPDQIVAAQAKGLLKNLLG